MCLSRLPGIGEKTATRLAFHLLQGPKGQIHDLAQSLVDVAEKVSLCSTCFNVTEEDPCIICADARRERGMICVVSSPSDVIAINRGGHFNGLFHVLHGLLSPLDGVGPDDLKIPELLRRLGEGDMEVIVATSANVEGEATALYLARLLKPQEIKVSRIASGIPVGGELEYSDQATIARAFVGRQNM